MQIKEALSRSEEALQASAEELQKEKALKAEKIFQLKEELSRSEESLQASEQELQKEKVLKAENILRIKEELVEFEEALKALEEELPEEKEIITNPSLIIPGLPIRGIAFWNILQNRILTVGIILILSLLAFPPSYWYVQGVDAVGHGHSFIFSIATIDVVQLILEICVITIFLGVAIFMTRSQKNIE